MRPTFGVLSFCIAALALASGRASAQTDFSGEWAGRIHEDITHRNDALGGGPEYGDYSGLPINAAARLRADPEFQVALKELKATRGKKSSQ